MNAITNLLHHLRRFLTRHSVAVAAGATFLTVLALLGAWRPGPSTSVVTVIKPLAAGTVVRAADLQTITVTGAVASDALGDSKAALGQRLRVAVVPGAPLRAAYFSHPQQDDKQGQTILLEIEPALATLLAPGDRVDIYQNCAPSPLAQADTPPCAATVLARAVEVVQVQNEGDSQWSTPHSASITIKAGAEEIKVLAGVGDTHSLTIAIVDRSE